MKPNSMLPLIVKVAPPVALGVLAIVAVKEIFFRDDKKPQSVQPPQPEKPFAPCVLPQEKVVIPPNSAGNFRTQAEIPKKSGEIPTNYFPVVKKTPSLAEIPQAATHKRNLITREHLKTIFQDGKIQLSRKTATENLQKLGFGKSAAYAALSPDGRFSAWLQFAPDGVISWKN